MARTSDARGLATSFLLATGLLLGVLGPWSYQACNIYNPSLLLAADGGTAEAGVDARPLATCAHVGPPPRPPDTDDQDGQAPIFIVAAFNSIDVGLGGGAGTPPFGYDLDNVCTCPGPPSCAQEKNAPESCDDEAGRDHTAIELFRLLGAVASMGTTQIDQGLRTGQYGLLLKISGYNLQPNDSRVAVSFYVSNGLNRTADGGIPTPQLNGKDLWTIDPGSLAGQPQDLVGITSCAQNNPQCQPYYTDDQAYVTGGVVVAKMPRPIPIAFGDRSFLGGATMTLSDAYIVGQLSAFNAVGGAINYNLTGGTIAGRWATQQLLSTLSTIPDPEADGGYLCGKGSKSYQVIKAITCGAADISQSSSNDNNVPLAPCDAVSVGLQFTAVPADLGGVLAVDQAPAGCTDGAVPFNDTCFQ